MNGVDLSDNNGWNAVERLPRSIDFVYAKITEGLSFVDPDYKHIFAACAASKRRVGGYHYAHPYNGGKAEADFFLKHWEPGPLQLVPALDLEMGSGNLQRYCEEFALMVWDARHCDTLLYGSTSFIAEHVGGQIPHMQLWLADWSSFASLPHDWKSWSVWQYKVGRISGVGSVDLDVGKMPLIEYPYDAHGEKVDWQRVARYWMRQAKKARAAK
jgi:lysozyme